MSYEKYNGEAHVDADVVKPERTFTKNLCFRAHCNGSNVARVDVKKKRQDNQD